MAASTMEGESISIVDAKINKNVSVLRSIDCELRNLSRSDGSALFCQGDTTIQAAVYGPTEVRINKELTDKAYMEVMWKPKTGLAGCTEKFKENFILQSLKQVVQLSSFPRTSISVIIQEMQNSGSVLACAVNAACLTLLDSAIAMDGQVSSVQCCYINDELVLDPNLQQEKISDSSFCFVFESESQNLVSIHTEGQFTKAKFKRALHASRIASKEVFKFYREALTKKLSKEI